MNGVSSKPGAVQPVGQERVDRAFGAADRKSRCGARRGDCRRHRYRARLPAVTKLLRSGSCGGRWHQNAPAHLGDGLEAQAGESSTRTCSECIPPDIPLRPCGLRWRPGAPLRAARRGADVPAHDSSGRRIGACSSGPPMSASRRWPAMICSSRASPGQRRPLRGARPVDPAVAPARVLDERIPGELR